MGESRHNPDQLLKEIQAGEENRNKGLLKIFFGYAAGVGKTYAMLEAAHMEKQQGIDVVAGYIEPHARPKTAALLNGLEVLPTREVLYNGMIRNEFDIDMALKRKPQIILVDELAHTNAEGCRPMEHPTRNGSSFSISSPACSNASFAAATAYWQNNSILFAALKSI